MVGRLALAVWLLNVIDWAFTNLLIRSGLSHEGNPLLIGIIDHWQGAAIKIIGVGLAMLVVWYLATIRPASAGRWVPQALRIVIFVYTLALAYMVVQTAIQLT
jgi:hypothetical protein